MPRRVRLNRTVLSIAIAQTQTEHTSSPTITVLTIQWACQKSVNSERSDEVSGSTDCATSAGFMGASFGHVLCGVRLRRSNSGAGIDQTLSLIHISEPTRRTPISYAVFCLKKKKK